MAGLKLTFATLILAFVATAAARADYPCPEPQPGKWHPVGLHYQQHSYFLPQLHRVLACFRPRLKEVYISDLHYDVPPSYQIQAFPCPFATPAAIYAGGRQP
jgi:hypothetical protein